jgi:hypothetical protein
MPLVKKTGYTVSKLADILTKMAAKGQGNLVVMIEIEKNGKSLITAAGRGDIGVSSDGRNVLVIRRGGDEFDIPNQIIGAPNGTAGH